MHKLPQNSPNMYTCTLRKLWLTQFKTFLTNLSFQYFASYVKLSWITHCEDIVLQLNLSYPASLYPDLSIIRTQSRRDLLGFFLIITGGKGDSQLLENSYTNTHELHILDTFLNNYLGKSSQEFIKENDFILANTNLYFGVCY